MYCYGCLYNTYTWKNQVYLSMITLVCELWVVWSLWICWKSGFACALCGPLSMCCCQLVVSFGFLSFSACQCVNKLLILIANDWLHLWHWNSYWGMFCGGVNHWICGWVCTFTDRDWPWQVEFLWNLEFMPSSWCS